MLQFILLTLVIHSVTSDKIYKTNCKIEELFQPGGSQLQACKKTEDNKTDTNSSDVITPGALLDKHSIAKECEKLIQSCLETDKIIQLDINCDCDKNETCSQNRTQSVIYIEKDDRKICIEYVKLIDGIDFVIETHHVVILYVVLFEILVLIISFRMLIKTLSRYYA